MPLSKKPKHIFEPTPLSCGQAAIAMATDTDIEKVCELCGGYAETDLKTMKAIFCKLGVAVGDERIAVTDKKSLPQYALLSLETPKCWHWSLYFKGKFYDPEYGVLDDFPPSDRRYYWEILE
ncbi:MAG: hypothetical protein IJF35_03420 [Clostridia bacterium]|nr:hypothetical protein [Clostridia bacterium]